MVQQYRTYQITATWYYINHDIVTRIIQEYYILLLYNLNYDSVEPVNPVVNGGPLATRDFLTGKIFGSC